MENLFEINIKKYFPTQFYKRNQIDVIKCIIRNKFIRKNREELIRQAFITYLIEELEVPIECIRVEVPMTRFLKGNRDRADIIVYADNEDQSAVCLIECKDRGVEFTDSIYEQVYRYHDFVLCKIVMITDGEILEILYWDEGEQKFLVGDKIPKYRQMISMEGIIFEDYTYTPWIRPKFKNHLSLEVINEFYEVHIGVDTPKEYYSFIINLGGLIYDETVRVKPRKDFYGINLIEDGGIRYADFGNNAGGSYSGAFRYFIIKDINGDNQIISLAIMANLKTSNHKRFGNNRGRTTFVVAIDNFEVSHNSLQLTIEDNVELIDNKAFVYHNASLTVSNLGSLPRRSVIDFVRSIFPDLIYMKSQRIFLGEFDLTANIEWDRVPTERFLSNVIRYCLVRDMLRRKIKENYILKSTSK